MEKKLNTYTNGNHKVTIYSDGTKIKETIDPKADHFTYDFPENFDIKITDQCDGGCAYCHENSTVNGKHGDLKAMEPMLATLQAGTECAVALATCLTTQRSCSISCSAALLFPWATTTRVRS